MTKRSILVVTFLALGAIAVALVAIYLPFGESQRLGGADCRPKKLAKLEACRGLDSSFQECRYYWRATGIPEVAWCRAALAATGRPQEPTTCSFDSPNSWAEVDCGRYGLARFDRCFMCVADEHEASRTYVYGYDLGCTVAAEQVTCNVDPVEAGRLSNR